MGRSKRVLFFALVAIAPTAIACNAILGIDDFRRVQCETDPCEPPDSGPDRVQPDNFVPDARPDAPPDAPPGVGPVSWAQFKMPNYKISVSDAAPTPLFYEIDSNNDIIDKVTGRVWKRGVIEKDAVDGFGLPGDDLTEEEAEAKCKNIPFGGPWRLPKRIELVTLLSHGGTDPFIDTSNFSGVPADVVWTSSEVRPFNGSYWAIDFKTGALVQLRSTGAAPEFAKALCVKDAQ